METPEKDGTPPRSDGAFVSLLQFVFGGIPVLFGGLLTFLFGIILLAYLATRLDGGPPAPGLLGLFGLWAFLGAVPLGLGLAVLWMCDEQKGWSRKKWLRRGVLGWLLLLLTAGVDTQCGPTNWHRAFARETHLETDVARLKSTLVTPHLEAAIGQGTNVLWCGTFQLAWNEACELAGGNLHFDQDHPMVALLNNRAFAKDSLDPASYVAMAGFTRDKIHEQITATVEKHFHGTFKPRFVPDKFATATTRPQDFVTYACLYKNMEFPVPFERLEKPLSFGGTEVSAFGMDDYKVSHEKMYPQVLILDYTNANDFIVELKTKSEADRIILAKVEPKHSLADTITLVRERIERGKAEPAISKDVLKIPRMKFDLFRRYRELEGRHLIPPSTKVTNDLILTSAVQDTAFELNEKGVELRSEAHTAFGCGKEHVAHWMVLDKPFLILLERTGAKSPYFALWVDNAELLTPW